MKRKFSLILCVCLVIFSFTACRTARNTIRFGAADIGGMYYTFSNTFAGLANDEIEGYTFDVKTTAGSSANLRLLSDNYIEFGIAQSDLIQDAYKSNSNLRAIAALYLEACQLVVKDSSDIYTLDDLQNKTISIGAEESGTQLNATQILEFAGLTSDIVNTKNLDYIDAARELKAGEIDAFFCTAGTKTTVIDELSRECKIRLISLDEKVINKIISCSDAYTSYTIPAGTYKGQDQDINTIGVKSVLMTSDSVSDDVVKQVTELLFTHYDELQYSVSLDLQIDKDFSTTDIPVPIHSGAISYYEEHGIEINKQ